MARLTIVIETDDDVLRAEDPHDVAEELLDDTDSNGNRLRWPALRPYAGVPFRFVSAEWLP